MSLIKESMTRREIAEVKLKNVHVPKFHTSYVSFSINPKQIQLMTETLTPMSLRAHGGLVRF